MGQLSRDLVKESGGLQLEKRGTRNRKREASAHEGYRSQSYRSEGADGGRRSDRCLAALHSSEAAAPLSGWGLCVLFAGSGQSDSGVIAIPKWCHK